MSVIEDGKVQRATQENDDGSGKDTEYDTRNTHPYDKLEISKDTTGKVTNAQVTLDPAVAAFTGSIGQIFGSAIGRALAPNDPFARIAVSTVAGTIGTKFAQVLSASLSADASRIDVSSILATGPVDLRAAGAGAVASFLVAELGEQLHFTGFTAQLFNAAVGGFAGSLAQQVARDGIGVLSGAAWGNALDASGISVGGTLGSILAHLIHPAETQAGALTGQLLGAVGALAAATAIGQAAGLLLDIIVPGIGSLIGTLLGTMIGDAFGHGVPHPTSVDLIDPSGKLYAGHHWAEDDGGDANLSHQLSSAVTEIVNAYLTAVDGMAIDHGKSIMIGYQTGYPAEPYITGWVPDGAGVKHFASAADAVNDVAIDILRHTETIGGNLLLKRAHYHSNYADTGILSGDLQVAQDFERYLDNREVINALMASHPDSAFTAGWAATFARANDLGLNTYGWSDFLGGLVGYLDSVGKAGLGFDAAAVSVKQLGGGSVAVEIKVPNGTDVPGSLSVFATQTNEISDASGKTVQFVFANGIDAAYHGPASATLVSGTWQVTGSAGNNLWFGRDDVPNIYHDNQAAGSNDILVGGVMNDVIYAGGGWDFVDGGAGNDYLFGQDGNDILRGGFNTDFLFGGRGDDTYVFNRGDGVDTVLDDYRYMELDSTGGGAPGSGGGSSHEVHADGGSDTLAFGAGIRVEDVLVQASPDGLHLIVGVKDPAHPGVAFDQLTDKITLQNWINDPKDRIEFLRFADGTTLNVGAAVGSYLVPFGETLSKNRVAENAAIGTVVGTVSTYDLQPGAVLNYSLASDPSGCFAINAITGAISVAYALNFEATPAWPITVHVTDQNGNGFNKAFAIDVTDVNEAPVNITLSGGSVAKNSAGGTVMAAAHGIDPDAGTVLHYSLTDNAGGRFMIYQSGEIAVVSQALIDHAASYQVTVRAADQYGLSVEKAFTLQVTDHVFERVHADFNGDGRSDVLWSSDTGSVAVWDSATLAGAHVLAAPGTTAGWHIAGVGDFDGNGKADILWQDGAGAVAAWDNGSPGGAHMIAAAAATTGWHITGVGDFDGNGKDDIFWQDGAGAAAAWDNGSPGGSHMIADAAATAGWHFVGVGDFDGNHRSDILWRSDNGAVGLWDNGSSGGSHLIAAAATTAGWHIAGVGDFDGNGKDDILWQDGAGAVGFWDNGSSGGAHMIADAGATAGWHIAGVGDFDGNGKDDILWQDASGATAAWDNGSPGGDHMIASGAAGWHIV